MLVPWAGEAERLVPGGKLDGAGAGVFRQGNGQHLDQDAVDVVFGLLFREAEGIDLHAIAEAAQFRVLHAIACGTDVVPEFGEGAHLAQFGDEADAGVHEEGDAAHHVGEMFGRDLAPQVVEHGAGGGQREGQFLLGRRACLLQVVGTDVHRVPFGQVFARPGGDIRDHAQAGFGRANIGPAREVFLDDVVLDSALESRDVGILFLGQGDVEREEPGRRRVDRHRGVHPVERDLVEEHPHVAQMADGDADLADLAARKDMVAVVTGLGGQVEGDGKARLPTREVAPIERVRGSGGGMARVGAEEPGLVLLGHGRGLSVLGNKISFGVP